MEARDAVQPAVEEAVERLEDANVDLDPELLTAGEARELLEVYARAERLAAFGQAALARRVADATHVADVTGTSVRKARDTIATSHMMRDSEELGEVMREGEISLDQAHEISKAEEAAPGVADELVDVAQTESFSVLRERARKVKLEAEAHRGLADRQRAARSGRSYTDDLGMIHVDLALEPHIGTPIVARAEADAACRARVDRRETNGDGRDGGVEPFECYLADAYAGFLSDTDAGRTIPGRRPELVVLVSYDVARRGWTDVHDGEICKIPGVGPITSETARRIADDAIISAVFYDGKDLRHFARWSRHIPVEVEIALELGDPPGFDGIACTDCGTRFRTEFDHVEPYAAGGPTSTTNIEPRCWYCHQAKTERDRRAGKLEPTSKPQPEPPEP